MRLRISIREGGRPPYAQVRDGVRRLIERGALLPGDRLPTVRTCAEQLELAPNTVARAYRELEDGGWLIGRGRAGTFVADTLPEHPSDGDAALATAADRFVLRARQLGAGDVAALRAVRRALS
jgi:GntR family transcriptional regulator